MMRITRLIWPSVLMGVLTMLAVFGTRTGTAAPELKTLESAGQYAAPPGAPYIAEEVVVSGIGYELAGTLTRTRGARGRMPAVLLITGTAPQDRDNTVGSSDYRPFREIADTLARQGIATLRLDDRGVGASTGSLEGLSTLDKATDASIALAFLRARDDIDGSRLAVLGHSEGALIATLVAGEDRRLRGLVLISSPAETGREMMSRQFRQRAMADTNIPENMRDSANVLAMEAWDQRAGADKWTGFFSAHDPLEAARKVRTPVLLIQGGADENLAATDADRLAAAFRGAGDKDVKVMKMDGLMHSLLRADAFGPDGAVVAGGLALPRDVLAAIVDWLKPHLR